MTINDTHSDSLELETNYTTKENTKFHYKLFTKEC